MSTYRKFILMVIGLLIIFGLVAPYLFSNGDDLHVLIGFGLVSAIAFSAPEIIKFVFKKKEKTKEKKE